MRIPYSWLREHCDPELSAEELGELLALRTTEVERISYLGPPSTEGFVVGRVARVEPHPDADRLTVCQVETGDATRTIVCGAPNVAAGQTVAVALPGAVMPGGQELGRAELRGVTSDGMILSEAELQIGEDQDGIIVLSESMPAASSQGAEGDRWSEPGLGLLRGRRGRSRDRARYSACGGPADCRARARARGRLEPRRLPWRLRGGAGGARLQRRSAGRGAVGERRGGRGRGRRRRTTRR